MELEVGMYVRTKDGYIGKIEQESYEHYNSWRVDELYYDVDEHEYRTYLKEYEIIKASHNIIDLIEVGDYVNGILIERIWERKNDCIFFNTIDDEIMFQITNKTIESIVTKEQFEQMSYKVGD